jgi:demethylmenaquinone methyltransferase/2-methoxy-6-polyprenyl-1,4-benzoquinol methylase
MAPNQPVKPYDNPALSKKEEVAQMFDTISGRYDFLNRFLSLGIDKLWRLRLIKMLRQQKPNSVLDIATGTADLAILSARHAKKVVGVDISEGMLAMGREKVEKRALGNIITLQYGDSENLQFADNSFDAITVAFGVRNFENLEKGLTEMCRVLKPGGMVYVLEFSRPRKFPVKQAYLFYFNNVLPRWGKVLSKDSAAYTYLPQSVKAFPDGEDFITILKKCGFVETNFKFLSNGIAALYTATKK